MKYLSVCSGIEAATSAWHPLGWEPVAFAEVEAAPSSVLSAHYPNVPNLGDMTKFNDWNIDAIDLLVGGTPCQSFSVAGLRKGLDDPRGNLMLTYGAIAAKYRPKWLVWENVPGVLSSNGGRDFGTFLGMLGQLGYGFAYRVLDAQYFGVAQRRRRVFVVGCLGDWRSAAAVLFERHSLQGCPAPSREAGQAVAPTIRAGAANGGAGHGARSGDSKDELIVSVPSLARCVTAGEGKRQDYETCTLVTHSLRGEGFDASEDGTGRGTPLVPVHCRKVAQAITSNYGKQPDSSDTALGPNIVAFGWQNSASQGHSASEQVTPTLDKSKTPAIAYTMDINKSDNLGSSQGVQVEHSNTLRTEKVPAVIRGMQVRRLTPRECERLQGFKDDHTLVNHRGKPMADGPRYKAIGNSMAVPCMAWIGRRIDMVDKLAKQEIAA